MTKGEYDKIQFDLSKLLPKNQQGYMLRSAKEIEIFERTILACKSVLHRYNPAILKVRPCSFCEHIFTTGNGSYLDEDEEEILRKRKGCKTFSYIFKDEDGFHIRIPAGDPYEDGYIENINFCPYCGRRLKEV